jgi:hypothetical protein
LAPEPVSICNCDYDATECYQVRPEIVTCAQVWETHSFK